MISGPYPFALIKLFDPDFEVFKKALEKRSTEINFDKLKKDIIHLNLPTKIKISTDIEW